MRTFFNHSDMITPALARIRSGDLAAFGSLYDMSYEKIYRFVFHRVHETEKTEDLVSEIYMKSLKKIGTFHGNSEGEFFSWMYRIAYTTIVDQSRSAKEIQSLDDMEYDPGYTPTTAGDIDAQSKLSEVMEYLDTLPEREKTILTMRIWDDLSYNEISEITGESVSNAKKIVSRTLAKISANVTYLFIFSLFTMLKL